MSVPFAHDNLGEEAPPVERPQAPDRHINFDQVHDPFYSQTDSPTPYPD